MTEKAMMLHAEKTIPEKTGELIGIAVSAGLFFTILTWVFGRRFLFAFTTAADTYILIAAVVCIMLCIVVRNRGKARLVV